jgi:ribonuclease HII
MARYIVGVDEVGRGALAGPVVVAVAVVPRGMRFVRLHGHALKDSKQLSALQREAWYAYFLSCEDIFFAVARIYPREIERMNISRAANLAALRAFKKLTNGKGFPSATQIFLDGGLFLGNGRMKRENPYRAKTVIKGDETIPAIAIASIIAKVHRDHFMEKLGKWHPEYGFAVHKGYGTKMHQAAIRKHGPSVVHRLTFLRKSNRI